MLGEKDFKREIQTIEQKLDFSCPLYSRMDGLYGKRQNVVPSYAHQTDLSIVDCPDDFVA